MPGVYVTGSDEVFVDGTCVDELSRGNTFKLLKFLHDAPDGSGYRRSTEIIESIWEDHWDVSLRALLKEAPTPVEVRVHRREFLEEKKHPLENLISEAYRKLGAGRKYLRQRGQGYELLLDSVPRDVVLDAPAEAAPAASPDMPGPELMHIGRSAIPWLHIDGDLVEGYSRDAITTQIDEQYWNHPALAQPFYEAVVRASELDFQLPNRHPATNGHGQKLVRFVRYRTPSDDVALHLVLRPARYFSMLATDYSLEVPLPGDSRRLRDLFFANVGTKSQPPESLATLFGVGFQLVTGDEKEMTVIVQRPSSPAVAQGVFFPSVAGGMQHGRDAGDPFITASEEAAEELTEVSVEQITFLAFGLDLTVAQYSLRGIARTKLSAAQIETRRNLMRDAGLEIGVAHYVRWTPEDVATFMSDPGHQPWTPTSAATIYYALVHAFSQERVERAFANVRLDIFEPTPYQDLPRDPGASHRTRLPRPEPIDTCEAIEYVADTRSLRHEFASRKWDCSRELLRGPEGGWDTRRVTATLQRSPFRVPVTRRKPYMRFLEALLAKEPDFWDGHKWMLRRVPDSSSDSPKLSLDLLETRFSEVVFHACSVARDAADREHLLATLDEHAAQIGFAHALSLHLVIETSDNVALLTQQSDSKRFYPGHWSLSLEEQLAEDDLDGSRGLSLMEQWTDRALLEELGLGRTIVGRDHPLYLREDLRPISLFVLEDTLSLAVCAHVKLQLTFADLQKLEARRRQAVVDDEVRILIPMPEPQLIAEFSNPTRRYHPSSRYRMWSLLELRHGRSAALDCLGIDV